MRGVHSHLLHNVLRSRDLLALMICTTCPFLTIVSCLGRSYGQCNESTPRLKRYSQFGATIIKTFGAFSLQTQTHTCPRHPSALLPCLIVLDQ